MTIAKTKCRTANMRLASCGVKWFYSSSVFQINFGTVLTVLCSEIPHERQAQDRYQQFKKTVLMDKKTAIDIHLKLNYETAENGLVHFSTLCGAIKDARKMTGRNIDTGAKDGSNTFGHLGSWLGTMG
jgi:hypothetical protein